MTPTNKQLRQHAANIMNTPEHLANAFVIAGAAWKASDYQNEQQYRVMLEYLERLQAVLGTDQQGAVDYILDMSGEVAA